MAIIAGVLGVSPKVDGQGTEVGFWEAFALADDRAEALKQLIPGTQDYYYYHCLHFQNTDQLDKVDELLKLWIKRYNRPERVVEIENRQALLRYEKQPAKSLEFVRSRLGIHFNHQRENLDAESNLPTKLDQKQIGREALTQRALRLHNNSMNGFEDRALEWASALELSGERRRRLLQRLRRPDVPGLPKLVVAILGRFASGHRPTDFRPRPLTGADFLGNVLEGEHLDAPLAHLLISTLNLPAIIMALAIFSGVSR